MDEFALIRRYFSDGQADASVLVGVGDDGAVVRLAAGRELVLAVDTLIESVHFPVGMAAADIGYRAVAVNLSDMAAMAARPRWMTLALTLIDADEEWLQGFASGLRDAAGQYGVALVGGDTTRGEQRVISIQLTGDVEPGLALCRNKAAAGDRIYVSGTFGDAAKGLALLQSGTVSTPAESCLASRFCRPEARVELGLALGGLASAGIDVSDGLAGDLGKLLRSSGCGARVDLERVPLSAELCGLVGDAAALKHALAGGDDYELCFTVAPDNEARAQAAADSVDTQVTCIGIVEADERLTWVQDGRPVDYDDAGYTHF